jgi:hypothetical protein
MRLETTMRAKRKIPEDYRPSEDEPFMSERQRAYFRRKLLSWREEILRSTKETLQHLHDDSAQHAESPTGRPRRPSGRSSFALATASGS